ncbi:(d)CMP kinase [Sphingobacterium sp. 1.A.5]|jgi:adenylate kinase family enzyme|uniref:(d)CMP kinase n=1 Tax=Sphingobacterium sp. 1.A.5 TaxID=2044604 RepID=UPI001C557B27|nr:(d)CMP kinase [Sphingobacterium sp. 1.A.5]
MHIVPLESLGEKICIIGPSSSGKSSLAKALGNKLDFKVLYLDQIAHLPNTNWQPREKELIRADHHEFINKNNNWIIEGNYSFLMKDRFSSASCIIWLDFKRIGSLIRFIKRGMQNSKDRAGNLEGAKEQINWDMLRHILYVAPKNRFKYAKLISESNAMLVHIKSMKELNKYYQEWELDKRFG